jgi:hypothetical protein
MCLLGLLVCSLVWFGCSSQSSNENAMGGGAAKPAMSMGGGTLDGAAMAAAMAKATSYKMTTKTAQAEMSMEVVCPDKVRMTTKTGAMSTEMLRIGGDMYMKAGSKWMKAPAQGPNPANCGQTAATNDKMPKTDASAKITKGGTQTINGETCTEWTTTVGANSSTICVGSDNLPRQIKSGEATITYSDWNKPLTIDAPKM